MTSSQGAIQASNSTLVNMTARTKKLRVSPENIRQVATYSVSTLLSAAITLGVPVFLHEVLGTGERTAVAISQLCAVAVNFVMIRAFVFRSARPAQRDFAYYVLSAVAFRLLEYLLFLAIFGLLHLFYFVALVITLCLSSIIKFLWYRFLFSPRRGAVV